MEFREKLHPSRKSDDHDAARVVSEVFNEPGALQINTARMAHLESLELPLAGKKVLDLGCGVGHLAQFFVRKKCDVLCVDGRAKNLLELQKHYPGTEACLLDIETERLEQLGQFDIVFCYGLLYHLENPLAALRKIQPACKEIFLLETIITDSERPLTQLVRESASENQALRGMGNRPSPSFVVESLKLAGFSHVYQSRTAPDHPDFQFTPKNNLDHQRNGHNLRKIFVASTTFLNSPLLVLQ